MDLSIISILRGLLGIAFILFIAFIFSEQRKNIQWKVIFIGIGIQALLAFLIINPLGIGFLEYFRMGFDVLGKGFVKILDFSKEGTKFLFSSFLDTEKHGFLFAFQVLPTIIFFSALTISEIFEDYIHDKKIKNVANKILNFSAIIIPLLTILGIFNLSQ